MGREWQIDKENCCGTESGRLCLLEAGLTTGDPVDIELKKKRISTNDVVIDFFSSSLQYCQL